MAAYALFGGPSVAFGTLGDDLRWHSTPLYPCKNAIFA